MALQLCSKNAIVISKAYDSQPILITKNADVALTIVGVTYLSFANLLQITHVLYTFTTASFAHDQEAPIFATHTLVTVRILLFKNSLLVATKPLNMKYTTSQVCATMLLMKI